MGQRWFPALGDRQIRIYLLGMFSAMLGNWALDITLNLLVWQLTKSPGLLGILNFLLYGPAVLLTPLLGTRLTAANARQLTLTMLWGSAAVTALLLAAVAFGSLPLAFLLGMALLRGVLNGMEVPSRQMLLLNISADAGERASALALNTAAFLLARTVGPALAAATFEPFGPAAAFTVAAAGTGFMLYCVAQLRPAAASVAADAASGGGLALAWEFLRRDPQGSLLMPVVSCVALCVSAYQTLIPVIADRVFGSAALWTGRFFAAAGVGALVGALLLSSRHLDALVRRLLLVVPWTGVAALALLGASSDPAWALVSFVVLGFCTSFVGTGTNALLHRRVPPQARGGLIALFLLAFVGAMPLGQLLAGTVASHLSTSATLFLLAGLLCAALTVLCGRRWLRLGRVEWDVFKI